MDDRWSTIPGRAGERMRDMEFYRITREFDQSSVNDIEQEIVRQLDHERIHERVRPGAEVAITAGSRGIANIVEILATLVAYFKRLQAVPFIVPAMGSHGGATADGQVDVLRGLGITEDSVGASIRSSMDVVELGRTASGCPVFFDRIASHADAVFVVNRVKVHTRFKAEHESGLLKMIAVGLGKKRGCSLMHEYGLYPVILDAARLAISKAPIIGGLGIVENSAEKTARLTAARAPDIERVDAELLRLEKTLLPSLPVDDIDLLIVDEMGKNISGTGMDTNVIGRVAMSCVNDRETPRVHRIVVLDLHEASHGNALGMGLADIVTRRFYEKIDFAATYENVIAANVLERAKMPVIRETDEDAVTLALKLSAAPASREPKVVYVKNTLALSEMIVSRSVLAEMEEKGVTGLRPKRIELAFDGNGTLLGKDLWKK